MNTFFLTLTASDLLIFVFSIHQRQWRIFFERRGDEIRPRGFVKQTNKKKESWLLSSANRTIIPTFIRSSSHQRKNYKDKTFFFSDKHLRRIFFEISYCRVSIHLHNHHQGSSPAAAHAAQTLCMYSFPANLMMKHFYITDWIKCISSILYEIENVSLSLNSLSLSHTITQQVNKW